MKKTLSYAAMALMLAGMSAQAAETCIKPKELEADKIRFVEVHLKVAALQCRLGNRQEIAQRYSKFVKDKMPYLVASQDPLKSWLKRSKRGSLDQYIVSMANKVSLDSVSSGQFCERSLVAAEYADKTYTPLMLLPLLPLDYKKPADLCKEVGAYALGR